MTLLNRLKFLSPIAKSGVVAGGYFAAIVLAVGVLWLHVTLTSGPDRDLSSGMHAFGDAMLFIAVFGVASILPTGLTLFFLRQSQGFWIALSVVALAVACTSLAAVAAIALVPQGLGRGASFSIREGLAVPRIFVAPFVTALFGLSAVLAPGARFRAVLFVAAGMEGASSVYGFFHWFAPLFFK